MASSRILHAVAHCVSSLSLPLCEMGPFRSLLLSGFWGPLSGPGLGWSVESWPAFMWHLTLSCSLSGELKPRPSQATGLEMPAWGWGGLEEMPRGSTWLFPAHTASHLCSGPSFQHALVILPINTTQCPIGSAQPCPALANASDLPHPALMSSGLGAQSSHYGHFLPPCSPVWGHFTSPVFPPPSYSYPPKRV